MKELFDVVSEKCSEKVTKSYSTSFSMATKMLATSIQQDIYNIYGFVRLSDEIVDSLHNYDKELLFNRFEEDLKNSIKEKISLNPILNSFQHTFHKYNFDIELVNSFMKSMRWDLHKKKYSNKTDYNEYIYGSADVVGLMCLNVFVDGDTKKYNELKQYAMSLGSAFQKVNFLRDVKNDFENLNRSYFPKVNFFDFSENDKNNIIAEFIRFHPLIGNHNWYMGEISKNRQTVYIDLETDFFSNYESRRKTDIKRGIERLTIEKVSNNLMLEIFPNL